MELSSRRVLTDLELAASTGLEEDTLPMADVPAASVLSFGNPQIPRCRQEMWHIVLAMRTLVGDVLL